MAGPWCPALPVTRAPDVELVPWPAVVLGRCAVYGITHTRSTRCGAGPPWCPALPVHKLWNRAVSTQAG